MTTFQLYHEDGTVSPELMTHTLDDAFAVGTALLDFCGARINFGPFANADSACQAAREISAKASGEWIAYQVGAHEFQVARRYTRVGVVVGACSDGEMLEK